MVGPLRFYTYTNGLVVQATFLLSYNSLKYIVEVYLPCKNILTLHRYIYLAKVCLPCKGIFTLQRYIYLAKVYLPCKGVLTLQRYIFLTKVYFPCKGILSLHRYIHLAKVSDKICDCEDHCLFLLAGGVGDLKVPVVRQLKLEPQQ